MAEPILLALDKVETCYGRSQVLFGISLEVAPGEMVTLMGRNGMGKTTTVRAIMGLTPASAGSIRFAGEQIRASQPAPPQLPEGMSLPVEPGQGEQPIEQAPDTAM